MSSNPPTPPQPAPQPQVPQQQPAQPAPSEFEREVPHPSQKDDPIAD